VVIYEAPLVGGEGRQTGWMSAVLDMSAQRRVEEISRQQQDRLQASARLATVGEMASLLSHELNQPLAAIASYASGSLNLLEAPDETTPSMLQQALTRIAEQADRAGRVIKSVHAFVRRREQQHETIAVDQLFEAVMPLVRMQARKTGVRVEVDLPATGSPMPRVRCDRTMVEQVLLNLSRNGIQAMDALPAGSEGVLTLRARQTHARWVTISLSDAGPGIAPDVAAKLFTPFFSTRAEGMGLGLSLCRTVIEQHGGALDFESAPGGQGAEFRFTLPTPKGREEARDEGADGSAAY
jgi:two-component system sensor histidine kinase DctS